jgi:hypothetical protein
MSKKVTLKVNDGTVPLNQFVQDVFAKVSGALVDTLDNIPQPVKKIEITIEEEES